MQNAPGPNVDLLLGMLDYAQPYLLPEQVNSANGGIVTVQPAPSHSTSVTPAASQDSPIAFKTLDDPASAKFTQFKFVASQGIRFTSLMSQYSADTAGDLALILPHAQELTRIMQSPSKPDLVRLNRLLTSTLILADAYVNATALLRLVANRTNPLYVPTTLLSDRV